MSTTLLVPDEPPASVPSEKSTSAATLRVLTNGQLLFWSCFVGAGGGLLGVGYYYAMIGLLTLVWKMGAHIDWLNPPTKPGFYPVVLIITTLGGLAVGLVLKYIGAPGEIAAVVDNIHMERGRIDPKQTPSMIAASLASITAGGSAGPEAPLVQIIGSFGSFLGDKLKLRSDLVRTLTFCGMGTALGAFFGAPLGGALFALEIPHRRGLEYFEALIPTILAATVGFFVFRSVVGYEPVMFEFAPIAHLSLMNVATSILFGLLGGAIGMLFILVFNVIGKVLHVFHRHTIPLAILGGLLIGLAAQVQPLTLFWAELQIAPVLKWAPILLHERGLELAVTMLLGLALMKMLTVGICLHSGFRGGFIFPLFFIGACVGLAVTLAFPQLPAEIVILSMMAAVNVAVTKTPVSTAVILCTLAGGASIPAVMSACLASFLLTTQVSLIRTQRSRILNSLPIVQE